MPDLVTVYRQSAQQIVNAITRRPAAQQRMALRDMAKSESPTLKSLAAALAQEPHVARDSAETAVDRVARVISLAGLTSEAYNLVDALGSSDPWRSIREALRVALEALLAEDDRPDAGNGGMRMVFAAFTSFDHEVIALREAEAAGDAEAAARLRVLEKAFS